MAESEQASNASSESWSSNTEDNDLYLVGPGMYYLLWNAFEKSDRHCWVLLSTTPSTWSSYSRINIGKTTSIDRATWQHPSPHCKSDESRRSEAPLEILPLHIRRTLRTSRLRITTFSSLSLAYKNDLTLSSRLISSGEVLKNWRTLWGRCT